MGADDDIHCSVGQRSLGRFRFGGGDEAREPSDFQREATEAFLKIVVMLAGKQGRRTDQCDLHSCHRGDECCAQGDFGLPETDVAADEAIHRRSRRQIGEHIGDGFVLIVGFLIGEAVDECGVSRSIGFGDVGRAQRAGRCRLEQFACNLPDALAHLRLAPLPCFATEAVERYAVCLRPIAREDVEIFDGHIQLVAARIAQGHAIVRGIADWDRRQAVIAPNAVIGMNHQIAGCQRCQFGEEGVGALLALGPPYETVAEHVLFGQYRDIGCRKAVVERQDCQGHRAGCGQSQRFLPTVGHRDALDAMIGQQARQPFARADRIAGDHDLAVLAQLGDVLADRFVDIRVLRAFGCEIAGAIDAEVYDASAFRLVEGAGDMDRTIGNGLRPLVGFEVKLCRVEGAIRTGITRSRFDAIGVVIADRLQPRFGGGGDAVILYEDCVVAQMLEHRHQPFLEQRQPMFHARQTPPVAHRLIERIAGCSRAEGFAIATAKALDRVFVQQGFGGGEEGEALHRPGRPLIARIEPAERFYLIAEEVEPQGLGFAAGIQIDDAAPDRKFACVMHGVGADIAVGLKQFGKLRYRDPLARREACDQLTHAERRQRALRDGIDRREDKLRGLWLGLQGV